MHTAALPVVVSTAQGDSVTSKGDIVRAFQYARCKAQHKEAVPHINRVY
jgi:hypothetical protein